MRRRDLEQILCFDFPGKNPGSPAGHEAPGLIQEMNEETLAASVSLILFNSAVVDFGNIVGHTFIGVGSCHFASRSFDAVCEFLPLHKIR